MKYINTEKLIAEIERLQNFNNSMSNNAINSNMRNFYDGEKDCCKQLISFIDSLQQEQFNDVRAEIEEYYGEDLAFEDERAKAAYHFFSSGKAFELREYEEERKKHITDLLDAAQKGMKAGYEKAISELKEGKVECSPVMKEFIDKLFGIGNTFNFGFGPKNIQQEQPETDLEKEYKEYVEDDPVFSILTNRNVGFAIACHFYELGLKAK